jgi:DNA-binding IclR family transcriptional regulator
VLCQTGPVPPRRSGAKVDETFRTAPQYPVGSVDNLLRLLSLFAAHEEIGVVEAARILEVAPSTAHRLLAMLHFHGYVTQAAATKRYRPGQTLINLGMAVVAKHDTRAALRPHLQELATQLRETVSYAVLVEDKIAFVDSVEASRALRVTLPTGALYPAHSTSAGKVLLACLDDAEFRRLYPRDRLGGGTARAPLTRTILRAELDAVRRHGYAVNRGESDEDVGAVAVAIVDRSGRVRGSLTTSMPLTRFGEADIDAIVAQLQRHAAQLTDEIV